MKTDCIFYNRHDGRDCGALKNYDCDRKVNPSGKCNFYKPKSEYSASFYLGVEKIEKY